MYTFSDAKPLFFNNFVFINCYEKGQTWNILRSCFFHFKDIPTTQYLVYLFLWHKKKKCRKMIKFTSRLLI